jgi:hypothetical protein
MTETDNLRLIKCLVSLKSKTDFAGIIVRLFCRAHRDQTRRSQSPAESEDPAAIIKNLIFIKFPMTLVENNQKQDYFIIPLFSFVRKIYELGD